MVPMVAVDRAVVEALAAGLPPGVAVYDEVPRRAR